MRSRLHWAFGGWLALITLAWLAVAPADWGVWPLVNAEGAASGWWRLRQHAIYLSGLWSMGLMSLIMVLALRLPMLERPLGGMDQVYRLHKWAGIGAALTAVLHWAAKEGGGLIADIWGRAGRAPRQPVWAWFSDARGLAKDVGEWAFYALLVLVLVTLVQRLLAYEPWRMSHRVMALLYMAFVFHTVALTPLSLWALPLGGLQAVLLTLGSGAALWSLAGWIGQSRRYEARIHAVQVLAEPGDGSASATHTHHALLEVLVALPSQWPGHQAGQFVFVRFDRTEGHHPFTIASASGALGRSERGEMLVRLLIKPLGDYTRLLAQRVQVGQPVQIEGPYGQFDGHGCDTRLQVWVAGGVGVTPFLAMLELRQPEYVPPQPNHAQNTMQPVHMHYCTRNAQGDAVLARLRVLCARAYPAVALTVHDAAQGQYLTAHKLQASGSGAMPLDIWFCGPQGLGDALQAHSGGDVPWHLHRELFAMR